MKTTGYIYCLSNVMYKGIYKIGFTKKNPNTRKDQLYTTGVLCEFKLEFAKRVNEYKDKEKYLHDILSVKGCRVNVKREFFREDLKEIKKLFDQIDGDWFTNELSTEYHDQDSETKQNISPLFCYKRNGELVKIKPKKSEMIYYKRSVNID